MEARVNWKEGLAFDGLGGSSGLTMPLDTSVESGGSNSGFRPMELLLVGLAGCTGMDVISILQKKKQDVTDFEVRVHGDRAEDHPKIFTHILIDFIVTGNNVDRAAVDRAVELSSTKYCSAQAMLGKAANIETRITIKEA